MTTTQETEGTTTTMQCPLCEEFLVTSTAQCYQTLDDHICSPNRRPQERPTVRCANHRCVAHALGVFWAHDGEGPYRVNFLNIPWIDGNPCPFNSEERRSYFQIYYDAEDRTWTHGEYTLQRKVRYRSDSYGHKTGKTTSYYLYKKNFQVGHGLGMFLYELKVFYRRRGDGESAAIRNIRDLAKRAAWANAEWWRKASLCWIKTVHPGLYTQAVEGGHRG